MHIFVISYRRLLREERETSIFNSSNRDVNRLSLFVSVRQFIWGKNDKWNVHSTTIWQPCTYHPVEAFHKGSLNVAMKSCNTGYGPLSGTALLPPSPLGPLLPSLHRQANKGPEHTSD